MGRVTADQLGDVGCAIVARALNAFATRYGSKAADIVAAQWGKDFGSACDA